MTINLLIIASFIVVYFLFSTLYRKAHFYIYDLLWRAIIILTVYFFAGDTINISQTQWYILGGVVGASFFLTVVSNLGANLYEKIISVLLAPVTEEFLFRGLLLGSIVGTDFQKVLIASLLFAVWHLKNYRLITFSALIYQIGYAFVIGFPLGYLAIYTNSLFLPIILHTLNNTAALLFGNSIFFKKKN